MYYRHVSSGVILKSFTFVKKKDKLQSICSIKAKSWNVETQKEIKKKKKSNS